MLADINNVVDGNIVNLQADGNHLLSNPSSSSAANAA